MKAPDLAGSRRPAGSRPGDRSSAGSEAMFGADLPASFTAPRQARAAVRRALTAWGLSALTADAELITSELVANAVEHGGMPIRLTLRPHSEPDGQHGILCQISDSAPASVRPQPLRPDSERGRGLHLVTALATRSGITISQQGKTAWFTLTAAPERTANLRQPGFEAEPGA